jgi:hypothetical protein
MQNNTYVLVWRKIKETSFYQNPSACLLAQHLIREVNWKDNKFIFNKQEMVVKRGQIVTGRFALSKATGLTPRMIRTAIDILSNVGFLTIKTTNRFSIITICKYNDYQLSMTSETTNQLTNNGPTEGQQRATIKEVKELKEVTSVVPAAPTAPARKVFQIPTLEEVQEYISQNKLSVNPNRFHAYYTSNGWKVGRNPMKNWKASIVTWQHKEQ